MDDLTERRSIFVYEAARLAAIAAKAPVIPAEWTKREEPFKTQFRDVIDRQCDFRYGGPDSPKKLHENWVEAYRKMGWRYGEIYDPSKKTHPDMVPFEKLALLEQDKDSVFSALCHIAANWIRG